MILGMYILCAFFQDTNPVVQEQVSVVVRQVKVAVTDKKGNPIKGLKAHDFKLKVNGEKIEANFFHEVDFYPKGAGEQPIPVAVEREDSPDNESPVRRPRSIAIILETGMATGGGFKALKDGIADLVATFRSGDRVRLYHFGRDLGALTEFTSNMQEVTAALDKAPYMPLLWQDISYNQNEIVRLIDELLDSSMMSNLSRGPSSDGAARANADAASRMKMGQLLRDKTRAKRKHARQLTAALRRIGLSLRTVSGDKSVYLFTTGGYLDRESIAEMEIVTDQLNWHNISIHALQIQDRRELELNGLLASHKVDYGALDQAQEALIASGEYLRDSLTIREETHTLKAAPQTFANETGGTFISATTRQQAPLRIADLAERSGHYYLISYQPNKATDVLSVKLPAAEHGKYLVAYGEARSQPKPFAQMNQAERDEQFAFELAYGSDTYGVDINWEALPFARADGSWSFPMPAKMNGKLSEQGYELGFVAMDSNDKIIDERKSKITTTGGQGVLAFYDLLVTQSRPAKIRGLIRNNQTGETALREFKLALAQEGPQLGSVLVLGPSPYEIIAVHQLNEENLEIKGQPVARTTMDPLVPGEGRRIPFTMEPLVAGRPAGLFFQALQLNGPIANYDISCLLKRDGEEFFVPMEVRQENPVGEGISEVMAVFNPGYPDEGDYQLELVLVDPETENEISRTAKHVRISEGS